MTAAEICGVTSGVLTGNPHAPVSRARADSRLCRPEDLYVALPGERTDGNLYASSAWENGASVVLADRVQDNPPDGKALVTVPRPLESLWDLARSIRANRPDLLCAGITGSNGKTTTKEILAEILRHWKPQRVLVSEGNYNSDIGLPLVMTELRDKHEAAVFEMGMNRRGEMALLTDIARPAVAVITNIGSAHIGLLGSRKAIAEEKRAVLSGCGTTAVVRFDDEYRDFLLENFSGPVRLFGEWGRGGWDDYVSLGADGFMIKRRGAEIRFRLPGEHNLLNAMAAAEAALALGAPEESLRAGLSSVCPLPGRSQIIRKKVTLIRDAYNANPESLAAALKLLSDTETDGRRVLVLGEMLELGGETTRALRQAGGAAVSARPDSVFLFGPSLSEFRDAALESGFRGKISLHSNIEELKKALSAYLRPGDTVLLKGSRRSALERLDQTIMETGSG